MDKKAESKKSEVQVSYRSIYHSEGGINELLRFLANELGKQSNKDKMGDKDERDITGK